jgi:hypothetical protein
MFKALVIGCGEIGGGLRLLGNATHGGVYKAHDQIFLSAGIDTDSFQAKCFSKRFGCVYASDLIPALEKFQPDVVSVCTPDDTHCKIVLEILSSSFAPSVIFLEKPACTSEAEYRLLLQASSEKSSVIVVNHSRRFKPDMIDLRARISNGCFGRLIRARATYYSGWLHNGTHIIDTLSFLMDDSISIINLNNVIERRNPRDPTLEFSAKFDRLRSPVDIIAIDEKFYQLFEFDLWFDNYRIRIEDFGERICLDKRVNNDIGEHVLVPISSNLQRCCKSSMQEAIDRIVSFLLSKDPSALSGCRLEDIRPTMNTLFLGQKFYEKSQSC